MQEENKNISEVSDITSKENLVKNNKNNNKNNNNNNNNIYIYIYIYIYIIVAILVLLIVGILFYKFILNKDVDNNKDNFNKVTLSDDVVDRNDVQNNDEVVNDSSEEMDENTISIYNHETRSNAYFYKCMRENCGIGVTDKGIIIYDEDKFWYRVMTDEEHANIFGEVSNPTKELLDLSSFSEMKIKKIISFYEKYDDEYDYDNENYIFEQDNELFVLLSYGDEIHFKNITENRVDDLLAYSYYLIDLKNKKIIFERDFGIYSTPKKIGTFYVFEAESNQTGAAPSDIINKNYEYLLEEYEYNYYTDGNNIYYIDDLKLKVMNSEKEIIKEYENIKPLSFENEILVYLDEKQNINIMNVQKNIEIFTSNIKLTNSNLEVYINYYENCYTISIYGDYLNDYEETYKFESFISENNLDVSQYEKVKKKYEDDGYNIVAYKIYLDNNGNIISQGFEGDDYY